MKRKMQVYITLACLVNFFLKKFNEFIVREELLADDSIVDPFNGEASEDEIDNLSEDKKWSSFKQKEYFVYSYVIRNDFL